MIKKLLFSLLPVTILLFPQLIFAQTGPTITLNPAIKYQIMVGWEAAGQSGDLDSPVFNQYADYLFDLAVNDLGINRVRAEIKSVPKGTVDSPFDITSLDARMDKVYIPMKQKLEARGEKLWINLCVVGSELANNPTMFSQQILATYKHLEQKYGLKPDSVEILEPDVFGWGNSTAGATKVGNAVKATGDLLTANGYSVYFVAPSNTNTNNATSTFIPTLINMPGVMLYIKELSYHDYQYSLSDLSSIKNTASQFGIKTSMLEHIGAPYTELHDNLVTGGVSAWQQFTLAYPTTDNGAQYYVINNSATTPQSQVTIGSRTKYLRQYFKYVRKNAQRIDAMSTNSSLAPVAFINKDGKYTVVVKATAAGNFSIGNLPAGTYGIFYTTGSQYNINSTDQNISSGQSLSAAIPAAGVITIYAKSAPVQTSPSPQKSGDIDGNNKIDIFDYNILLTNFGLTGTNSPGDLDGDGKVGIFDYNLLLTNFGK